MSQIVSQFGNQTLTHEWHAADRAAATILLFPTVMGVTPLEQRFAEDFVAKGWSVLVADLYGRRFAPEERDGASAAMQALRADRAALRERLLHVLGQLPADAASKPVVAIGFCFGGQCALDLARAGAAIAGAASFHGLFDPPGLPEQKIAAKVIAFHGWADALAKPDSVVALAAELDRAGCDWQLHAMGHVGHAFTNPGAAHREGFGYDATAARRAFGHFDRFMADCGAAARA